MIWLILFVILFVADVLVFIYLPAGTMKEVVLIVVSTTMGTTGFSLKDFLQDIKAKREIKNRQRETVSKFNSFFASALDRQLSTEGLDENNTEITILTKSLENTFQEKNADWRNSLITCFYCKKWDVTKDPADMEMLKRYAEVLEIKYGQITEPVKTFLGLYGEFIADKTNENDALKHFTNNYYKDLQFYDLKEELHEAKNFHNTLVTIIKEGKLSTYGITVDTLNRLQKDLQKRSKYERTFLLIANNVKDTSQPDIKSYIKSLPGFTGTNVYVRNIDKRAALAIYVVKPQNVTSAKEFVQILKEKANNNKELIIRVIPLDFLESEDFTIPTTQQFSKKTMSECYEAIEWFKSGLVSEDSLIWNEVAKSSVTPDELLGIIPFNIFCPEILISEQTFFIKHYDYLKNKLNVTKLNEWKDKEPKLIVNYLLENGTPDYSSAERKQLKINGIDTQQKIEKRLLKLAKQIKKGATDFDKALKGEK